MEEPMGSEECERARQLRAMAHETPAEAFALLGNALQVLVDVPGDQAASLRTELRRLRLESRSGTA